MMRKLSTVAAALSVAFAAGRPAAAQDEVIVTDARTGTKTHKGKVTADDADKVIINVQGALVQIPPSQVKEIRYDGGKHVEYQQGKLACEGGDYTLAAGRLEEALRKDLPKLLRQYVLYYKGLAHRRLGETDEAIRCFEELKAMGSETKYLYEAGENLADLYLAAGQFDKAMAVATELEKGAKSGDRARIQLIRALVLERQKQYQQAMLAAKTALDLAGAGQSAAADQGNLVVARCEIATKRYSSAKSTLASLLRNAQTASATAEAYVLLGDATVAESASPSDLEEALFSYLRVCAGDDYPDEMVARAFYEAGRVFQKMGDPVSAKRAETMFVALKKRFPDSEHAAKVR